MLKPVLNIRGCLFLFVLFSPLSRAEDHAGETKSEAEAARVYLNAVTAQHPAKDPNVVEVKLPIDRCKPGILKFGEKKCSVLGRGQSLDKAPPVKASAISLASSLNDTPWKHGKSPDGKDCFYKNENIKNGSTPGGNYRIWLDGARSDTDAYGKLKLTCMDIPDTEPIADYGRSELRIHSGRETLKFQARFTHGCLRIDPLCQGVFNDWLRSKKATSPTCEEKPETTLSLSVSEVDKEGDLSNE